jgi:beta-xylosidase/acetyl esterase/lipase
MIKLFLKTAAAIGLACVFAHAQNASRVWVADMGDGTYRNPIIHADYSDPDVVRVGDDYYMTASSFNAVPGLPILHSKDLVNWRLINHVFREQEPRDTFRKPQHGGGVWAPAIRFHAGEFYIYFPDPDFGIYMTKTKDPTGEWSKPLLIAEGKGWIDPCPLWDDDGNAYLVHAFAGSRAGIKSVLVVKKMNREGTKLLDDGVIVFDGHDADSTVEGPKFLKRDGYYYIFAPAGGVATGWQLALRSKNIYGPYERKVVLAQGNTAINGPHQGGLVDTPTGEWWFIHFQDRAAYGRIVHLQPAVWKNGFPVIGEDKDGDGTGEPVMRFRKPNTGSAIATPPDSDEFNGPQIGPAWQWHANAEKTWVFPFPERGVLRMNSVQNPEGYKNLWELPNLLLQKFPAEEFTATAKVKLAPRFEGERFSLVVMGLDYSLLGVTNKLGKLYVTQATAKDADKGTAESESSGQLLSSNEFYLRVSVAKDAMCTFSFSSDGKTFTNYGLPFKAREGRWIGAKLGFVYTRPAKFNDAGTADIDWFRFEPTDKNAQNTLSLPPGYTVFSVDSAERGIIGTYPFITRPSSEVPDDVEARRDVMYAKYGEREMRLDLFKPKAGKLRPALIVVHGGAWITGHHTMENPLAIALAKRGYVTATVEHRLSNEKKYPAQIHDLKASVRWLRANAKELGIDPNRIGAIGGSSGGHLVALLGVTNDMPHFEGDGGNAKFSSRVQSVVDIDGTATFIDPGNIAKEIKGPWDTNTKLTGFTYAENPAIWKEASPITHVNKRSAPTLFLNSSADRPFQQREEMAAKLNDLGVYSTIFTVPNTPHPFWLFKPWFDTTVEQADIFFKKTMSRK